MEIDKKDIFHIGIIIVGILFLAIPIFHSNLWFDESYSVGIANHSFQEIWEIGSHDVHPILYYWILHIMNLIFGNCMIAYRIFSWICACAVGILGFTHIRKDFGKKVGILFSFFSLFLPVITIYAGEIRMYTFAMLVVSLMCIYAYRIYKNEGQKQIKNWILFAIFSLASAYTHYYGLMVAGIVNLIMFTHYVKKVWKTKEINYEMKAFIVSAIVQIIVYLPWLIAFVMQMSQVSKGFWISFTFPGTIIELFTFQFAGGMEYSKKMYAILFASIIIIYLIYLAIKNKKNKGKIEKEETLLIKLSLGTYFAVIIGACLASLILRTSIINARYLLCVTGVFLFFLAYYLAKRGNKYIIAGICALCVIMGIGIEVKLCKDNYDNSNQQPFTYLKENIQEGDAFLSVNELNAFILVTNFPENTFYFWDESDWNVEEAYKAFGKRMQGIENLDEIKEVTGRIWVLDSRNDHLLEKIQEQYDIKVIERKEYDTKYHGCQYTYTLIEKQ